MPSIPVYPRATLNDELRHSSTHRMNTKPRDSDTAPDTAPGPSSLSGLSASEDPWHVGILLGQISMQQTSVQFPYFEGPSNASGTHRTAAKRKHPGPETVTFAPPVVAEMMPMTVSQHLSTTRACDSSGPTARNRKIRTCKRCKQPNCEGIFLSRPCKVCLSQCSGITLTHIPYLACADDA